MRRGGAPTTGLRGSGSGTEADDKPGTLSGGQQQRVALRRALAFEPRLLLLDEPLAALDAGTRAELRRELRTHLASVPGARVFVTHELLDAVALADRLVILEHGRVVQEGTMSQVSDTPRSRYVADLVGINLLRGVGRGHEVVLSGGGTVVTADEARGEVYVAVHPHAVSLHRHVPEGSARNVGAGTCGAPTCSVTASTCTSTAWCRSSPRSRPRPSARSASGTASRSGRR